MSGGDARARWAGLTLLGVYAATLLAPPATDPAAALAAERGLLERLFPGVPAWWMGARLLCALGGMLLLAAGTRAPLPLALPVRTPAPAPPPWARLASLALAAMLAIGALFAARLDRTGQSLGFALLPLPALILTLGAYGHRAAWTHVRAALPSAAVLALWILLRAPLALHAPRSADLVDTWFNFEWLARAAADASNLLTDAPHPGSATHHLLFLGVSFLGPGGAAPSLPWLQVFHLGAILATAACIARLAATVIGRGAAPVAAAVFLFSPFALYLPYTASAIGIQTLLASALLLALAQVGVRRAPAALAWVGVLAGLAAGHAQLAALALAACVVAAFLVRRSGGIAAPLTTTATACCLCFAAAWPALPDPAALGDMWNLYVGRHADTVVLEAAALGQRPGIDLHDAWLAGRPQPLDIPLGALLAPFAVARTSIRLWGDALLEPLGAALAAGGIALALRFALRHPGSRALLVALGVALLPGLSSSYDRAWPPRFVAAPVVLALCAAAAFEAARRGAAGRPGERSAGVAAVAAVAVGGIVLFDAVNPRILAASAPGIALRALQGAAPPGGSALLGYDPPIEHLHLHSIATHVPARPLPVLPFPRSAQLVPRPDDRVPELFFWSPGLERDAGVTASLCRRWPGAARYELLDDAGLSRTLAARPAGPGWTPALPPHRWRLLDCGSR